MSDAPAPHIGTLNENHLHAALKEWAAQPGDLFEVKRGRYVIDIVRGEQLIEIQTRGVGKLKRKLAALSAKQYEVTLVYPISQMKWIVKEDAEGNPLGRRKSPLKKNWYHLFAELVYFPDLLALPNLSLQLLLIHEEEHRHFEPRRAKRRRRGWVSHERRLLSVIDHRFFHHSAELAAFIPPGLPDPFSTADLASVLSQPRRLMQQMCYCLRAAGVLEIAGKVGNSLLYRLVAEQ